MAKRKPKPKSPFLGRWHIVWMSGWDEDYFNEEVQAYIDFEPDQRGEFQFGYVRGDRDYREGQRDGRRAVEWSWEGTDGADGTPMSGRGWAALSDEGLDGMIFIDQSDDSEFEARKVDQPPPKSKNPNR